MNLSDPDQWFLEALKKKCGDEVMESMMFDWWLEALKIKRATRYRRAALFLSSPEARAEMKRQAPKEAWGGRLIWR